MSVTTVPPPSIDGTNGRRRSAVGIFSTPSSACSTQIPDGVVVNSAIAIPVQHQHVSGEADRRSASPDSAVTASQPRCSDLAAARSVLIIDSST